MPTINSKTIARIAAVQALYQYELNSLNINDIEKLYYELASYYQNHFLFQDFEQLSDIDEKDIKLKLHSKLFKELIDFTISNLDIIDQILVKYLNNNGKEGLHFSLQALIRVGVTELKFFPEIPQKVTINEYTSIAAEMLSPQEVSFVNSILDKISKEIKDANAE